MSIVPENGTSTFLFVNKLVDRHPVFIKTESTINRQHNDCSNVDLQNDFFILELPQKVNEKVTTPDLTFYAHSQ